MAKSASARTAPRLLSGNEGIARGAFEAGVRVACAYPGTPSTEILETLATFPGVHAQWSVNEKVALEVGIGASLAGARALVAMKHVGLNVASDPFITFSYTGVKGGLVVVTADDPGMHSSQNEQDNRHYARLAKVPMLEPSDSQEARDFVLAAFELSEQYDTPVLVRITTRIAHSRSRVEAGERREREPAGFESNREKYVMIPAHARKRHPLVEDRMARLAEFAESTDLNRVEGNGGDLGVITSGVSYQYVKEVCPEASILKLGLTYPLSARLVTEFASEVDELFVVEELDPFLEEQVRAMGLRPIGKERVPRTGELNPHLVRSALRGVAAVEGRPRLSDLPPRPPVMCPGCPHRGVFHVLNQLKCVVFGDIGCYTLGVLPPLAALDTCICMGAGVGNALGMEKALDGDRPVVAVIGDSTFIHSGITGLIDTVYNDGHTTIIILDNATTAMTGHQDHPGTGRTLQGREGPALRFEEIARAVGVRHVSVVDPYDLGGTRQALEQAINVDEPAVVISRHPCVLVERRTDWEPLRVDEERCEACGLCLRLGCPALSTVPQRGASGKRKARINPVLCRGCRMCAQVCKREAIVRAGGE